MSAEDTWQLKIPVRLSLSNSEITSPVDVKPAYLLAPRFAYLPALAEQCLGLFQHVLLSLPGQTAVSPWFEYQGLALNWTQPLGVLHDLLSPTQEGATAAAGSPSAGAVFSAPASPWCLTVHYRNMPAALNNSWQNAGAAKDHYITSLKEAGYCCRGSEGCGAVMRLPGQAQDDLWAAINKGDGASASSILNPLKLIPTPKQGGITASVPVRLYIRRHKSGSSNEDLTAVWEEVCSTSRPVEAAQLDGSPTLLAHLLHITMPQRFPAPVSPSTSDQQQLQQLLQQWREDEAQQETGEEVSQQPPQEHQPPQQQQQRDSAAMTVTQPAAGPAVGSHRDTPDPLRVSTCSDATYVGSADQQASGSESAAAGGGGSSSADVAAAPPRSSCAAAATAATQQTETGSSMAAKAGSGKGISTISHVLPDQWPANAAVFVCGIQPDWRTPIAWLHANLRAADCFLYVVVHLMDP